MSSETVPFLDEIGSALCRENFQAKKRGKPRAKHEESAEKCGGKSLGSGVRGAAKRHRRPRPGSGEADEKSR